MQAVINCSNLFYHRNSCNLVTFGVVVNTTFYINNKQLIGINHKGVIFILDAISIWLGGRNFGIGWYRYTVSGLPLFVYFYTYIYIYMYYLCKYIFMNFYIYQHKI